MESPVRDPLPTLRAPDALRGLTRLQELTDQILARYARKRPKVPKVRQPERKSA